MYLKTELQKYPKKKIIKPKITIDEVSVMVGYYSHPLSVVNKTSHPKMSRI